MAFNLHLAIERAAPSFSTVMLWVKKAGYCQLQLPKEKADDWIIIADESIGIGQEKALVVLGIRRGKIDFTRPLKLQDMDPVLVKSKERWTGEDIALELEGVKQKLGTVIYAVTDAGNFCDIYRAENPEKENKTSSCGRQVNWDVRHKILAKPCLSHRDPFGAAETKDMRF